MRKSVPNWATGSTRRSNASSTKICKAPHRFRTIDGETHRHLADDFPYAVLYLNEPDHVWVVAVMPLKRDPDYWKHRLTN